jgi:NDP-sugar pyrophosphorylase family protein
LNTTRALIMAGGRSERMRATAGPLHKALVPVAGVPLLERNLRALLCEGFQDIVVAVSKSEPEISKYVDRFNLRNAAESGASVQVLYEAVPLGTIGAAREAIGSAEALLVLNVDNLTRLPLRTFVAFHYQQAASLTIAAHVEPFQIPFGELDMVDDRVQQYVEKPVKSIWISSGTYVVGRDACDFLLPGRRTDIPDFVATLLRENKLVAAFRHATPWIDVNHAGALRKAEEMVELHG